jgi:serine/threonine protein kinase
VKVTDFGLARMMTNTATALTLSNQVVGTPNYMAPEQIKSMEVDARVDIYALGVTLWQFLTGTLPFEGATPMAVLLNVVGETLSMPKETFEPLPKELREAVVAMTAKDPKRRLPNVPAVLAVLKKARDALRNAGLDSTAPMAGTVRASSPRIPSISDTTEASRLTQAASLPRSDPKSFTKALGSEMRTAPPQTHQRPGTPGSGSR